VYEAAKRNKMDFKNIWQDYPSTTPMFVEEENKYNTLTKTLYIFMFIVVVLSIIIYLV
jgi:hypothetical protein